MELEYMEISDTCREQLQDYNSIRISIYLHPLVALTGDAEHYQRAKHIDIRYHFIRDVIAEGQVIIDYIFPADQPEDDVLTKALGPRLYQQCVDRLGLWSMSTL
jgi:hypothetical protein